MAQLSQSVSTGEALEHECECCHVVDLEPRFWLEGMGQQVCERCWASPLFFEMAHRAGYLERVESLPVALVEQLARVFRAVYNDLGLQAAWFGTARSIREAIEARAHAKSVAAGRGVDWSHGRGWFIVEGVEGVTA